MLSFPLEELRNVVTIVLMASSISEGVRKIRRAKALNAQAANGRYYRIFGTHASCHWALDAASFINRKTCVHMQPGGKTAYFYAALVEGGGRHNHRMLRGH